MSDINNENRHIESIERFLTVCIERLQTETKTSDRFFTQTAFNNAIKEFVIAEARNNRKKLDDIERHFL
jgi:ribosomal protein L34E